jgi:hypothetical protein
VNNSGALDSSSVLGVKERNVVTDLPEKRPTGNAMIEQDTYSRFRFLRLLGSLERHDGAIEHIDLTAFPKPVLSCLLVESPPDAPCNFSEEVLRQALSGLTIGARL